MPIILDALFQQEPVNFVPLWFSLGCLRSVHVLRLSRELNGFNVDVVSAVHLDRTMTAPPVVVVLCVSRVVHVQRSVVCEIVPAVIAMA
jgi:hypothetical protein